MTPGEVLIPGAIAIIFVVTWFVVGIIDAARGDSDRKDAPSRSLEPLPQPARHTADTHRR